MDLQTLKTKAKEMKSLLRVLYWACQDERTPWYTRVLIALVLSYAVSPIDLIPDFIPVLGYLDDLILIPAGIALAIKLIPEEVIVEYRGRQDKKDDLKMNRIYGGFIILILWLLMIYLVCKCFGLL